MTMPGARFPTSTGRFFSSKDETRRMQEDIRQFQGYAGTTVEWWLFNFDASAEDPIYGEGFVEGGKRYNGPRTVPVMSAVPVQGDERSDDGFYAMDRVTLIISVEQARLVGITPDLILARQQHLLDRFVWRGYVYDIQTIQTAGHFDASNTDLVFHVVGKMLQPDQLVDSPDFARYAVPQELNGSSDIAYSVSDPLPLATRLIPGPPGNDGDSAYQIAVQEGFLGSMDAWLASLKGPKGDSGNGDPGESAYQIAVDNGFSGTQSEWLTSLQGAPGAPGNPGAPGGNGESAYQLAVDNGFVGSEAAWLASLQGEPGTPGTNAATRATATVIVGVAGTASGNSSRADVVIPANATNAQTYINQAVGMCAGAGKVVLLAGVYLISGSIQQYAASGNVVIECEPGAIIRANTTGFQMVSANEALRCQFINAQFDGNSKNAVSGVVAVSCGATGIPGYDLINCTFVNFISAPWEFVNCVNTYMDKVFSSSQSAAQLSSSSNMNISNISLTGSTANGLQLLQCGFNGRVRIRNADIAGGGLDVYQHPGTADYASIYMSATTQVVLENVTTSLANEADIWLVACTHITAKDCDFSKTTSNHPLRFDGASFGRFINCDIGNGQDTTTIIIGTEGGGAAFGNHSNTFSGCRWFNQGNEVIATGLDGNIGFPILPTNPISTAPAPGTQETWTIPALSSTFNLSSFPTDIPIYISDSDGMYDEANEIIQVVGGWSPGSTQLTVIRGAKSTTPVAHDSGHHFTGMAFPSSNRWIGCEFSGNGNASYPAFGLKVTSAAPALMNSIVGCLFENFPSAGGTISLSMAHYTVVTGNTFSRCAKVGNIGGDTFARGPSTYNLFSSNVYDGAYVTDQSGGSTNTIS